MKKLLHLIFLLFLSLQSFSQEEKEDVHILFNEDSKDTCMVYKDGGGLEPMRFYTKISSPADHGKIHFYICQELFLYDPNLGKKEIVDTSFIAEIKFSSLEEMEKVIDEREKKVPFSYMAPNSAFSQIYLLEKINDQKLIKYEVEWVHYIE